MGISRCFVQGIHTIGDVVELASDDGRKLTLVLRCTNGSPVHVIDSSGRAYAATLLVDGTSARARIEVELQAPPSPHLRITLAQGIPKGQKMDFIVEKATELGVASIVPFVSERTIGTGARAGKSDRWQRLAKSASQQSGRGDITEVAAPVDFDTLVGTFGSFGRVLVPWELSGPRPLRDVLPPLVSNVATLLVAIGPEGGFSDAEVGSAQAAGAHLISLGRRILRTETAGLVTCAAAMYACGDL